MGVGNVMKWFVAGGGGVVEKERVAVGVTTFYHIINENFKVLIVVIYFISATVYTMYYAYE